MNPDNFFSPQSVAIFGLSDKPGNLGRNIIINCRRWGYRGRLFGISPSRSRAPVFDSIEEAVGCLAGLRDQYLKLERLKNNSNP